MLKEEIVVGKAYINEHASIVREVVEEVDSHHVRYNAFDLTTGRLIPASRRVIHRRELARWADREAEPRETARIHPHEQGAWLDANGLVPLERGTVNLERARAALQADPGTHTFPPLR